MELAFLKPQIVFIPYGCRKASHCSMTDCKRENIQFLRNRGGLYMRIIIILHRVSHATEKYPRCERIKGREAIGLYYNGWDTELQLRALKLLENRLVFFIFRPVKQSRFFYLRGYMTWRLLGQRHSLARKRHAPDDTRAMWRLVRARLVGSD